MSLNLAMLLKESARSAPDKPALILGDAQMTYAELDGLARRFASGLMTLGVRPGQHVALMIPNVPHFTVAYFGAHYAGLPVVPLNVLLTGDEVAYHLNDADAVALVVWEGFLPQAEKAARHTESLKHLIVARGPDSAVAVPRGGHDMMQLARSNARIDEDYATRPDDTAVILYTSGTTGRPKGAELTHFNMFYNAQYVASRLLGIEAHTVGLTCLPMFHSFGQTVLQNALIYAGGTNVLMPRFEPKAAFALMQEHRVSLFAGVPTMYFALLHEETADSFDLSSLTTCVSGGSAMPVEVMRTFDEKYGVNILEGYGLSETSPVASFNVLDQPKKPGSIGLPIWGVEMRLVDDLGRVVDEDDVPGEICIKGHNVMKGYYKRPEATQESIVNGWFKTGDVATRDGDGYYFIIDRKKDMIIRGGFNVYPREVEEALYRHPAISEAAVIGVPSERYGEEVKAVVALKPGRSVTEAELLDYCKEHLGGHKYPRIFEIVESLPKGPTGKILKRELRAGSKPA
jgi:long-chain acyl-CoA synthetase